ncbi:hypothetical protein JCM14469_12580 [Desulfatiferula olefinivorans]
MSLFKKKYRFIQTFDGDRDLSPGRLLGLYRAAPVDALARSLRPMTGRVVFPHFGFTFYDDPPGRIIRKGRGDIPSMFEARRLLNLGRHSLFKRVSPHDMFTDEGLAVYRELGFQMLIGAEDKLPEDLAAAIHPRLCPDGDPVFREYAAPFIGDSIVDDAVVDASLRDAADVYDEVFCLDFLRGGYHDAVYLTADTLTSVELSHSSVLNIIRAGGPALEPVCQVPLSAGRDGEILSEVFSFDPDQAAHLTWNTRSYPLFGVFPGLFAFDGALFDVATGLVSGKRRHLVRFLLYLNGKGLLSERDLRYLV